MKKMRLFAVSIALVCLAFGQEVMTNESVVKLVKAGLGEGLIVNMIQSQPGKYSLTADDMVKLKSSGVPDKVMAAMVAKNNGAPSSTPAVAAMADASPNGSNNPEETHSPGVYMYASIGSGHRLTELQRATVKQTKGKGAALSGLTYGIKKFKVLGVFDGPNAPISTSDANPVFYLYSPDDQNSFGGTYITPQSFTLIKLSQKGNTREVEEASGSIWGTKVGEDDKAKHGFSPEKVKSGIYKLTLVQELPPGEYAFSQNNALFFDFRVVPPQ